jgi:hypothetical protein
MGLEAKESDFWWSADRVVLQAPNVSPSNHRYHMLVSLVLYLLLHVNQSHSPKNLNSNYENLVSMVFYLPNFFHLRTYKKIKLNDGVSERVKRLR